MWAFGALLTLPYRLVPSRIIGEAFAVINVVAFVGGLIQGSLVGGLIQAASGSYLPAFVVLAVCLLAAGLVPFLYERPEETPHDELVPAVVTPHARA